ncbi:MAG: hypothetical protein L0Z55_08790, partial [Planctomycetes bacterium]|nr:hypothetical protein [Planctomycetota bacterium]
MISSAAPLRTIWLMGAKTRLIPDFIESAVQDLLPDGGTLLDLCAGTGIVGRTLADRYAIIANDVHRFCGVLASAHLEGGAKWAAALEMIDPEEDLHRRFAKNLRQLEALAPDACAAERELLERVIEDAAGNSDGGAASAYRAFIAQTPDPEEQGTPAGAMPFEPLRSLLPGALAERRSEHGALPFGLMTFYYQNIYFGVRQAMVLDSLRAAIARLPDSDPHAARKRTLYLAALIYAASVSTSGTSHFAQPRSLHKSGELLAVAKRRTIDIEEQFHLALDAIRREWGRRQCSREH